MTSPAMAEIIIVPSAIAPPTALAVKCEAEKKCKATYLATQAATRPESNRGPVNQS